MLETVSRGGAMPRRGIMIATLAGLMLAAGCDRRGSREVAAPEADPDAPRVIRISTVEEFVNAIGPNRTIEIPPGDFVLSDVPDRHMEFIRWDPVHDGASLTIRNVENLVIRGDSTRPTRLLVRSRYAFVLAFENCGNLELAHLVLGHEPERGFCDNGVIGATQCTNVTILNCDLFGSGTEGLTLDHVSNFEFTDSIIRECTYGILTIRGSDTLRFVRSRFERNRQFTGLTIHDTKDLSFIDCVIEKNTFSEELLDVVSSSGVKFQGGFIRENRAATLAKNPAAVEFEGTQLDQNRFAR